MSSAFEKLCEVVARLRAPGGCPWDQEQTNESLLPALLEEAYEVVGAVRAADDTNLREELGDLLLQIVMHAEIARGKERFDIKQIIETVTEKLIRRHPHVFGTSEAHDSGAVLKQWEAIKREEKSNGTAHLLDDLPAALPALMRAQKAQEKAARVNFDWADVRDVIAKVHEELDEAKKAIGSQDSNEIENEIGDLFFAMVNLARKSDLDAEITLHGATNKFVRRFNQLEDQLAAGGKKLGDVKLAEMDAVWHQLKNR